VDVSSAASVSASVRLPSSKCSTNEWNSARDRSLPVSAFSCMLWLLLMSSLLTRFSTDFQLTDTMNAHTHSRPTTAHTRSSFRTRYELTAASKATISKVPLYADSITTSFCMQSRKVWGFETSESTECLYNHIQNPITINHS
jgi:hypothetical protein